MPRWLSERMARLGRVIVEAIVLEYGRPELLRRMAHPFWFQSFGAVMGMDWHSSGITTSVIGALKRGLAECEWELGVHVCGGRGSASRRTPDELRAVGQRTGLDGDGLAHTSRLVAKVDSAAVQDGFELYLHGFLVTDEGDWTVVQQGMNPASKTARRYHWSSERIGARADGFVDEPHSAIDGQPRGNIINLTDHRADRARRTQLELVAAGPDRVTAALAKLRPIAKPAPIELPSLLPHLVMPAHHEVRSEDVVLRRLHGALAAAAERGPRDFADLLMVPGVGARTVEALALVAEVVHGAPCRFTDPARFSVAHGGKDRHPFPVPLKVYDRTIRVLREAVERARLGNDDKLQAIRRLDGEARRLESSAEGPSFDALVEAENRASHRYGGMSVFGPAEAMVEATVGAEPDEATPTRRAQRERRGDTVARRPRPSGEGSRRDGAFARRPPPSGERVSDQLALPLDGPANRPSSRARRRG